MTEKVNSKMEQEQEKEKPTQPTQTEQEKPKPKGILGTATNAEAVTRKGYWVKALLVGPSGSGKTQSSITIPGKKLLIDYDGRWETVVGTPEITIIKLYDPDPTSPKGWMRAEQLKRELWRAVRNKRFDYDLIIEDGLTSMLNYAMNWSLTLDPKTGLGESPAQQHWMPQMYNVEQHIRSMKQLPCSYILNAHVEYIEVEDEGSVLYLPKATGKMRTAIPGWFNETYWCSSSRKKDGKVHYYWETTGTGKKDFLKSTLNNLGKYWTDPIEINFDKPPVGFADLLERRFGKEESDD